MKSRHFAWIVGLLWGVLASAQPGTDQFKVDDDNSTAATAPTTALTDAPVPDSPDPGPPKSAGTGGDFHVSVSPYLWIPGVHGIIGAFGRDANLRLSPIDLLSHFDFGLMGTAEARWNRLVLPIDMVWVRLSADKALPAVGLGAASVDVKSRMFILTPKVGVRLLDSPKIKCTFLTGIRYWHLGQTLEFSPSILNLNFSASQNWVDPLVGGRIELPVTKKFETTIFGDVGGWGTGSQLDYQVGGLLGYKIKETVALQAGYRYLNVNYRGGGLTQPVFDTHLSGVVLGATFNRR